MAVKAKWIMVQNGKGVCSNCNRQDGIDPLAKYCRYCGAEISLDKPIEPPTEKQMAFIRDIEEFIPEKFHGLTKEDASDYISRNKALFELETMDSWQTSYM